MKKSIKFKKKGAALLVGYKIVGFIILVNLLASEALSMESSFITLRKKQNDQLFSPPDLSENIVKVIHKCQDFSHILVLNAYLKDNNVNLQKILRQYYQENVAFALKKYIKHKVQIDANYLSNEADLIENQIYLYVKQKNEKVLPQELEIWYGNDHELNDQQKAIIEAEANKRGYVVITYRELSRPNLNFQAAIIKHTEQELYKWVIKIANVETTKKGLKGFYNKLLHEFQHIACKDGLFRSALRKASIFYGKFNTPLEKKYSRAVERRADIFSYIEQSKINPSLLRFLIKGSYFFQSYPANIFKDTHPTLMKRNTMAHNVGALLCLQLGYDKQDVARVYDEGTKWRSSLNIPYYSMIFYAKKIPFSYQSFLQYEQYKKEVENKRNNFLTSIEQLLPRDEKPGDICVQEEIMTNEHYFLKLIEKELTALQNESILNTSPYHKKEDEDYRIKLIALQDRILGLRN